MSLSPEDVEGQRFKQRFKGYDMDEVDLFLDQVVARLHHLLQERDDLRRRLEDARSSSDESERLLQRTLLTAQRTADQTIGESREEAERIVAAAHAEASRESERLAAEAEQLADTVAELRHYQQGYLAAVRGVIEEQLASLEQAAALPEMPPAMEALADAAAAQAEDSTRTPAAHGAGDRDDGVVDLASEELIGRSALDADPRGDRDRDDADRLDLTMADEPNADARAGE